jgi:hypothetical protein
LRHAVPFTESQSGAIERITEGNTEGNTEGYTEGKSIQKKQNKGE